MRVSSPQVLATLMPPPFGMWRSHTTRSGLVDADHLDGLVGVAGLADDVEVAAEVGAHAGAPDRVVVGQDDADHLQLSHRRILLHPQPHLGAPARVAVHLDPAADVGRSGRGSTG